MKKNIKGYRVNQDCTLDYTNFEQGEEIIIADHCEDNDWKGTEWYDSFPQIFEPIEETLADKVIRRINDTITDLMGGEEQEVRNLLELHKADKNKASKAISEYLTSTLPIGVTPCLIESFL